MDRTEHDAEEHVRTRAWDPAAYRRFVAELDDDLAAARAEGEALADQDRELGWTPAASPITLWALLSDIAGGSDRSRAALVACVAHVTGGPNTLRPLTLGPDPEAALVHALGGMVPKDRAAWPQYLASLATEVSDDDHARLPKGPLTHVRERATQLLAGTEDAIQDALAAAYEEGSVAGGWDDTTTPGERQLQVATATDALARAVADTRVEHAIAVVGATALPVLTTDDDPSALVLTHFPIGIAIWREVVRAVVRGDVVAGIPGWRSALWALQTTFTAGTNETAAVRTGSRIVQRAAERAGVSAIVTA